MKYLKLFFMAAMIFGLAACSGSASYSPERCKALAEKIKSNEELTEGDYTEMIDQLGAAAKTLNEKEKAFGEDKEAEKAYKNSTEAKEMMETMLGFAIYLQMHEKDLTPANQKHLQEVGEELKALNQE